MSRERAEKFDRGTPSELSITCANYCKLHVRTPQYPVSGVVDGSRIPTFQTLF